MLEAHERDSLSVDNELAGISGADAYHEQDVDIDICLEEGAALLFRVPRERHNVDSLEHSAKVYSARKCGRSNDFLEMRPRRIEDVIMPVGF
jgi:hypothetical protein